MQEQAHSWGPRTRAFLLVLLGALVVLPALGITSERAVPEAEEIASAIERGLAWLETRQEEGGAWAVTGCGPNVGATAQGAYVYMLAGHHEGDPIVSRAIEYVLAHRRDDGSFGSEDPDCGRAVYETSLAILALGTTGNPEYLPIIEAAALWLVDAQNDEGEVYETGLQCPGPASCWAYGGWCYDRATCVRELEGEPDGGSFIWSDNSNTQFAIIALAVAERIGLAIPQETWAKAEDWVTRCRYPDGGYGYQPPEGLADQGSYGSMTAAAIWELGAMGIPHNDPRVQDGLAWLEANYRFDENPNFGKQWHYYYLWTAARGLLPIERIGGLDDWPQLREWFGDFAGYLVEHQQEDGSWSNPEERYGENPGEEIITQYAVQVLLRAGIPDVVPLPDG